MTSHRKFIENVEALGISSIKLKQETAINVKTVCLFIVFVLSIFATYVPFLSSFESFKDYIISIYMASTTTTIAILYVILIWKMKTIFKIIESTDSIIQESKWI